MDALRSFFEHAAPEWDATQPAGREEIMDRLIEPFDDLLRSSTAILDIGAGTGIIIPILKKRAPHATVASIDLAHAMLAEARRRTPGADVAQADVHHLPFESGAFSVAICHNSFPHFGNKEAALKELNRVLASGGSLLIVHNISRARVNAIHMHAQAEILHHDLLPDGETIKEMLLETGFLPLIIEDNATHYVVAAEKKGE
jgi:CsoR family transcriptional regulator, copper-sensing transcriptional repressor